MTSVRLRYLLCERDQRENIGHQVLSVYRDHGVVPKDGRTDNFNKTPNDTASYKLVKPGDVVVNKMKAWTGSVAVSAHQGIVSGDYMVCAVTGDVDRGYLHHLLRSRQMIQEYIRRSTGIRPQQWRLYWSDFADITVELPDIAEQQRIADFLNVETARIEALIAAKLRQITLVGQRHETEVDRLLRAEGSTTPLKRAVAYQEGPGIMAAEFRSEGVPLIRVAGAAGDRLTTIGCNFLDPDMVERRWAHFKLQLGDYVISASATMGTASIVDGETVGAIPYTGLIRLWPRSDQVEMRFVRHFLQSSEFRRQIDLLKTGSTIQHFGPTHLDQVAIKVPGHATQVAVADTLDLQRSTTQAVIAALETQIELLRERRQVMIAAAVSGELVV